MGAKIPLFNWHDVPCSICYFIVILFCIERKWLLMRNLTRILPLKSKSSGKSQCFNAIDGSIKMLRNRWIYKNFNLMKSCKTFYEAKKTSRINEIIQPPLPTQASSNKILLRLFLQSASRMQFWASKNGGVIKCFFWDQTRTCLLENFY